MSDRDIRFLELEFQDIAGKSPHYPENDDLMYFKQSPISEEEAYYHIFRFIRQFLKANFVRKIEHETWQTKRSFMLTLDTFGREYYDILHKLGWKFHYLIKFNGEPLY